MYRYHHAEKYYTPFNGRKSPARVRCDFTPTVHHHAGRNTSTLGAVPDMAKAQLHRPSHQAQIRPRILVSPGAYQPRAPAGATMDPSTHTEECWSG